MFFVFCGESVGIGLISNDNSDRIALFLYRLDTQKDFFFHLFITSLMIVGIISIIIRLIRDLIIRLVATLTFYEWLGQNGI